MTFPEYGNQELVRLGSIMLQAKTDKSPTRGSGSGGGGEGDGGSDRKRSRWGGGGWMWVPVGGRQISGASGDTCVPGFVVM